MQAGGSKNRRTLTFQYQAPSDRQFQSCAQIYCFFRRPDQSCHLRTLIVHVRMFKAIRRMRPSRFAPGPPCKSNRPLSPSVRPSAESSLIRLPSPKGSLHVETMGSRDKRKMRKKSAGIDPGLTVDRRRTASELRMSTANCDLPAVQ